MPDKDIIKLTDDLLCQMAPMRDSDGHKGTFGTALIVAGSRYMTGAAVLSSGAALRSGCGMVRVLSDEQTLNAVRYSNPCALLSPREGTGAFVIRMAGKLLDKADSVLIGPGIPEDDQYILPLLELFIKQAKSLVIDAGAITCLAGNKELLIPLLKARKTPAILTPHPGEFARLFGGNVSADINSDYEGCISSCLDMAKAAASIVVLKNSKTLIALPDGKMYINDVVNSGLGKGGSGDVLAGLMAGLLAQGINPETAAVSAVRIHSDAGLAAASEYGQRAMLPSDLYDFFPDAYDMTGWN